MWNKRKGVWMYLDSQIGIKKVCCAFARQTFNSLECSY